MTVKLIGTDTAGDTVFNIGYVRTTQYTCALSGSLSEINVYCTANGDVRVALYSDNADDLGTLLGESADTAITATGWKSVSLGTPVNVVSGTKYWLAVQIKVVNTGATYRTVTARSGYYTQAYGAFPANGPNTGIQTTLEFALQGYGTPPGWANIASVNGATATDLASWNGATLTDLASWSGADV